MAKAAGEELPADRQPVVIAALRTPVRRVNGAFKELRAHELLAPVLRRLLTDTGLPASAVSDVVIGNAVGEGVTSRALPPLKRVCRSAFPA